MNVCLVKAMVFPVGHIWMCKVNHKERDLDITYIKVQRKLWVVGKIEQDLRKKVLLCRKWKESEESRVHFLGRSFKYLEDV